MVRHAEYFKLGWKIIWSVTCAVCSAIQKAWFFGGLWCKDLSIEERLPSSVYGLLQTLQLKERAWWLYGWMHGAKRF